MTFSEDKVFIVRLISNEEIIGLLVDQSPISLMLPYQIGLRAEPAGQISGKSNFNIHLAPFLPLGDDDVPLPILDTIVAFKYKPTKEIIAKYKEIYYKATSGLVLA